MPEANALAGYPVVSQEVPRTEVGAASGIARPERANESLAQAERELKLAQMRLERAKLEREAERTRRPWWRNWNITAITAIVAAIAPATAGVSGYFERQKQLALAEQQQQQESARTSERQLEEIRNRYLDRVKNPDERRRTLRFLLTVSADPQLQEWARKELPIVDAEAKRIEEDIAAKEKVAAASEALYLDALSNEKDKNVLLSHMKEIAQDARRIADGKKGAVIPTVHETALEPPWTRLEGLREQAAKDKERMLDEMDTHLDPAPP